MVIEIYDSSLRGGGARAEKHQEGVHHATQQVRVQVQIWCRVSERSERTRRRGQIIGYFENLMMHLLTLSILKQTERVGLDVLGWSLFFRQKCPTLTARANGLLSDVLGLVLGIHVDKASAASVD